MPVGELRRRRPKRISLAASHSKIKMKYVLKMSGTTILSYAGLETKLRFSTLVFM